MMRVSLNIIINPHARMTISPACSSCCSSRSPLPILPLRHACVDGCVDEYKYSARQDLNLQQLDDTSESGEQTQAWPKRRSSRRGITTLCLRLLLTRTPVPSQVVAAIHGHDPVCVCCLHSCWYPFFIAPAAFFPSCCSPSFSSASCWCRHRSPPASYHIIPYAIPHVYHGISTARHTCVPHTNKHPQHL